MIEEGRQVADARAKAAVSQAERAGEFDVVGLAPERGAGGAAEETAALRRHRVAGRSLQRPGGWGVEARG
eukprot:6742022-Prymnesium_polylepis.1